jgi:hypothetical protein
MLVEGEQQFPYINIMYMFKYCVFDQARISLLLRLRPSVFV